MLRADCEEIIACVSDVLVEAGRDCEPEGERVGMALTDTTRSVVEEAEMLSKVANIEDDNNDEVDDRVVLAAELIAEGRDGVAVLPIEDCEALEVDVTTGWAT